jgi:hypothetical protein
MYIFLYAIKNINRIPFKIYIYIYIYQSYEKNLKNISNTFINNIYKSIFLFVI